MYIEYFMHVIFLKEVDGINQNQLNYSCTRVNL